MQENGMVDVQNARLRCEHEDVDQHFISRLCPPFFDYFLIFLTFEFLVRKYTSIYILSSHFLNICCGKRGVVAERTSYELNEMRDVSPIRHNTLTLESQPEAPNDRQNSTSRQISAQLGASNSAPALTLSSLFIRLASTSDQFRKIVDGRWAESLVGKTLLAASEQDSAFRSAYVQTRKRTNTNLNTLFDIQLSLPSSVSNHSFPILKEYSLDDCLDGLHRVLKMEHSDSFIVW